MPIYNYICKDCDEKFDLLVGVTAEKEELKWNGLLKIEEKMLENASSQK